MSIEYIPNIRLVITNLQLLKVKDSRSRIKTHIKYELIEQHILTFNRRCFLPAPLLVRLLCLVVRVVVRVKLLISHFELLCVDRDRIPRLVRHLIKYMVNRVL